MTCQFPLPLPETFTSDWEQYIADSNNPNELLEALRDLSAMKEQISGVVSSYSAITEKLEQRIGNLALTADQKSAKFENGSAEMRSRDVAAVEDWDAYYAWLAEAPIERMPGFLHKRAGSTAISKFAEDNGGELPPGCAITILTDLVVKTN
jgi:hypothetical protein